jgi:hypothetical protein
MNFPIVAMVIGVLVFVVMPYILAFFNVIRIPMDDYAIIVAGLLGVMILLFTFLTGPSSS